MNATSAVVSAGAEALSVGRHVATALDDLADELVRVEPDGHCIQRRTALSALLSERMAVVTLLGLEDEGALTLERRPVREEDGRDGISAPGVHLRTPRRVHPELGQGPEEAGEQHQRQHRDRTPPPAL